MIWISIIIININIIYLDSVGLYLTCLIINICNCQKLFRSDLQYKLKTSGLDKTMEPMEPPCRLKKTPFPTSPSISVHAHNYPASPVERQCHDNRTMAASKRLRNVIFVWRRSNKPSAITDWLVCLTVGKMREQTWMCFAISGEAVKTANTALDLLACIQVTWRAS